MHLYEYVNELETRGYSTVGTGSNCTVLSKENSNCVLKVCDNDIPYLTFIKKIRKLNNPYFPKVISIHKIYNFHIIKLEKLKPVHDFSFGQLNRMLKKYDIPKGNRSRYFSSIMLKMDSVISENSFFGKAKAILDELCKIYSMDIHDGNIMFRKNQVVFIDPIWDF